ncbi:hypothetical protein ABW21_db0203781 [Orbilia brochopaga]|nr:hypothetical protein ABW21_db0203781 [Drechslerella brochopaga]
MLSTKVISRSFLRTRPKATTLNTSFFTPRRLVATESVPASSASSILASQRLNRPISPHLTIYQPQLTWYLSSLNRITGVTAAGIFYLFTIGYAFSKPLGIDMSAANVSRKWSELSTPIKLAVKAPLAAAFSFHCWNGVRHLVWDAGKELSVRGVYRTGYAVLGLTAFSTVGLLLA